MSGIAGIALALVLLVWLAYRGVSVLLLAPLLAMLAALLSADAPLLASYTQVFMKALGGFIALYFPLFLLGAIFGKLMQACGAAAAVADWIGACLGAQRAILSIVLACAILTYGGVSLFVVAFAVHPIAAALFERARLPARLIPATIALGAFTFTMTALPGTPAIQNAIPMPYFQTTPFAAPGLGILAGLVMLGLGMAWLNWRARRLRGRADPCAHAAAGPVQAPAPRPPGQGDGGPCGASAAGTPPAWAALLPIVLVVALNYVFSAHVFVALDTSYLALAPYAPATLAQVIGIWSILCALALSILALVAFNYRRLDGLRRILDEGANAALLPIFNTASLVGFGAVIASLAAFAMLRDAVLGIAPGQPLISLAIAVNLLAGITGSASGGMSIALETLGPDYLALARSAGIAPELLHRVTTIATGGLDSLPHNGAVITLLSICKLDHRRAYGDIFMVAVAGPLAALAVVVTLGTLAGSF
ncbi:GntP family permease [Massilia sp. CCM 8733]|uniref:GntP family permease n=1 Tax=Massilia mucilaginosa TaxID=2609282 RepID=A0ABX0NM09_9BURK|nr:GntP family permease [Massilia mucilaginosa]NHZ87854.1 GntP family permease [Massilia mucilaginosa]